MIGGHEPAGEAGGQRELWGIGGILIFLAK